MLRVETTVKDSGIHGRGLFTVKDIPKGTVVWKHSPAVDELVKEEGPRRTLAHGWWVSDHCWLKPTDDARFINHSDDANVIVQSEKVSIASRDIKSGEEITENYYTTYRYPEDWPSSNWSG